MSERTKNSVLLVVSILFCLGAMEGILRVFDSKDYTLPIRLNNDGFAVHKFNLDKFRFDDENKKAVHIKTNAEGFVGENHTVDKPSSTLRIAFFGDSFTEAMQIDYENAFPSLVEKRIQSYLATRTSTPYKTVEVLNFGVGGTAQADAMLFYVRYAQKYNPDIVIDTMYVGNDVDDNSKYFNERAQLLSDKSKWFNISEYSAAGQHGLNIFKNILWRSSALVRFIDKVFRSNPIFNQLLVKSGIYRAPTNTTSTDPLFFEYYYYMNPLDAERQQYLSFSNELLNHFKEEVEKDHRKFILMLIPEGMPLHSDLLKNYIADHPSLTTSTFTPIKLEDSIVTNLDKDMAVVRLSPLISETLKTDELYLNKVGHFNEIGHRVAAQALTQKIEEVLAR